MHIKNLKLQNIKNEIHVLANITFRGGRNELMYFMTDKKNKSFISADYSPFLAAVLLPCMKTGEDIYVDGSVSADFLQNTNKIMELVEDWNIGLKKVDIHVANAYKGRQSSPKHVASFFSAGVDSFYSYLKHKRSKFKITDLILVHGFDIPLSNKDLFTKTRKTVEKIAKEEKIRAIFVETNAGEIVEKKLIWDFSHGGILAGVGLFLGKGFKKILIPAGVKKDEVFPYGTHPDLDKLWSTKNTKFVHDGTEYNRLGKIMNSISKSPLALKHLRVCSQNLKGKYNCSRCYKCLQTMIALVCANALKNARTFGKLDLNAVRNMYYDYKLKYNLQGEASLAILKRQNREEELQRAITYSLEKSKKPSLPRKFFQILSEIDQKYIGRKLYYYVFKINKKQDRNILFKALWKLGVLK